MPQRFKSFINPKSIEPGSRSASRSLRSGSECEVPKGAREIALRIIRILLNAFGAENREGEIDQTQIAPHRLLVQLLPIRVYVYTTAVQDKPEKMRILSKVGPPGGRIRCFQVEVSQFGLPNLRNLPLRGSHAISTLPAYWQARVRIALQGRFSSLRTRICTRFRSLAVVSRFERLFWTRVVYTLDSPVGETEFQSMLESQRRVGTVFDAFEIGIDGARCGFYVYSLQPVADSDFLTGLWQRIRLAIGEPVRTAAAPEAHARHHREAARRPEDTIEEVSIEGDPNVVAENLIRPHLPAKFLDDISLETDEGIGELLWLLMRRMGRASIEKDELIRFVQRNERPLRSKLEMLPVMAEAARASDKNFGMYFDYFYKNVQLALAGKTDEMDMRSDRLFWLLFALTQQLDADLITYSKAREIIACPETVQRISEHQLIYMFYDFADALETPHQASRTAIMLLAECAIVAGLQRPLRCAVSFFGKYPTEHHRDELLGLLGRAGVYLKSLGEDASDAHAAKARLVERNRSVSDDDF